MYKPAASTAATSAAIMPKLVPGLNRTKRGPMFSGTWGDPSDPGFGLEPSDMGRVAQHLPGCAVTYEHSGLHDAVGTLDILNHGISGQSLRAALNSGPGGVKRPVGTVLEASDDCGVVIHIDPQMDGVASLVRNGELRGLSLTTVAEPGRPAMPVELTLCTDPARGIEAAVLSDEYKFVDDKLVRTTMEATSTPPAAEKTALETALESMPEEQRAVVIARLEEYEGRKTEDEKTVNDLKIALQTRETMLGKQETDKEVLLAQFDLLKQRLDGVEGVNLDGCREALQEPERTQQMNDFTLGRIIEACSRGLQSRKEATSVAPPSAAATEPAGAKKRKVSDPSSGEGLRNLLRATF